MQDMELFARLAMALAIGLLFGLERGWQQREEPSGERSAGVRTFALIGLLGGIVGWISLLTAPVVLGLAFAGVAALVAVGYWLQSRAERDLGMTTEFAMLLVFGLGAAALLGEMAPIAAVAVVATLLLAMKRSLHDRLARIERLELDAALKLAVLSVAVLPVLPDRGFGPGSILNPHDIWWAVVIVAGLSFFGYLAIRLLGARTGVLATGAFGGLASSTSTTVALARLARRNAAPVPMAAAGIVLAGTVTFLRILLLAAIFEPRMLAPLRLPMIMMAAAGAAGALILQLSSRPMDAATGRTDHLRNPLELTPAMVFGGVLALVITVTHFLGSWLGARGVLAAAALSGITDVDAITISVAGLVGADLAPQAGALAVVVAACVNTVVKGALSLAVGTPQLGRKVLSCYAGVLALGVGAVILQRLWPLG